MDHEDHVNCGVSLLPLEYYNLYRIITHHLQHMNRHFSVVKSKGHKNTHAPPGEGAGVVLAKAKTTRVTAGKVGWRSHRERVGH